MDEYTAKVTLRLQGSAFSEEDLCDIISDLFAPGEYSGLVIEKCEINNIDVKD